MVFGLARRIFLFLNLISPAPDSEVYVRVADGIASKEDFRQKLKPSENW